HVVTPPPHPLYLLYPLVPPLDVRVIIFDGAATPRKTCTLSLHDALPISLSRHRGTHQPAARHQLPRQQVRGRKLHRRDRGEERSRSARLSSRTAQGDAARPQGGGARGADGGVGSQT